MQVYELAAYVAIFCYLCNGR